MLVLTQQVVHQAQHVQQYLQTHVQQPADRRTQRLATTLQTLVPQVERVITQTTRRVIQGASVPADEKLVSLHPAGTRPHTAIIRQGKAGKPVKCGRVLWLGDVEGGIITQARVLAGNPDDAAQFVPRLDQHIQQFGRPPNLVAGDGKLATPMNEQTAQQRGVKPVVLPRPGRKAAARKVHERQCWFRHGRNWRAGIEGRMSGLKRQHGLRRCRYHGAAGMERWVGWGVLAPNLRVIAQHHAAKHAK